MEKSAEIFEKATGAAPKKITVKGVRMSATAKKNIEAAGGSVS